MISPFGEVVEFHLLLYIGKYDPDANKILLVANYLLKELILLIPGFAQCFQLEYLNVADLNQFLSRPQVY